MSTDKIVDNISVYNMPVNKIAVDKMSIVMYLKTKCVASCFWQDACRQDICWQDACRQDVCRQDVCR